MQEVRNRVTDPLRVDFSLLHRISDVLARELDAQAFELMGRSCNLTDLLLEIRDADVKEVSTHGASAERVFERRGGVRRRVAVFDDYRGV
jgi:hypothetical protein